MTSVGSNFNFLCGLTPSTYIHLNLTSPPCGRHKWMALGWMTD